MLAASYRGLRGLVFRVRGLVGFLGFRAYPKSSYHWEVGCWIKDFKHVLVSFLPWAWGPEYHNYALHCIV